MEADADKTWQQHIEEQDALVKDLEARLEQINASSQACVEDENKTPVTKVGHWLSLRSFSMSRPLVYQRIIIRRC